MRIKDSRTYQLGQLNEIAARCEHEPFTSDMERVERASEFVERRRAALAGTIYAISELGCILGIPLGPLANTDFLKIEFALAWVYGETSINREAESFLFNRALREILVFSSEYTKCKDVPESIRLAYETIQERVSANITTLNKW